MLQMNDTNMNFNGSSVVNDTTIATFSASYSGHDVYFSFNIADKAAHAANEQDFETDLIAFKDQVMSIVDNMQ